MAIFLSASKNHGLKNLQETGAYYYISWCLVMRRSNISSRSKKGEKPTEEVELRNSEEQYAKQLIKIIFSTSSQ